MLPKPLVVAITSLVSLLWAASVIVGLFSGRAVDPLVHAAFSAIVIGTFTVSRGKKDEPSEPTPEHRDGPPPGVDRAAPENRPPEAETIDADERPYGRHHYRPDPP